MVASGDARPWPVGALIDTTAIVELRRCPSRCRHISDFRRAIAKLAAPAYIAPQLSGELRLRNPFANVVYKALMCSGDRFGKLSCKRFLFLRNANPLYSMNSPT